MEKSKKIQKAGDNVKQYQIGIAKPKLTKLDIPGLNIIDEKQEYVTKEEKIINKAIESKLSVEHKKLFEPIAQSMTEYLAKGDNYKDLVKYLSRDIQKNSAYHILCNDEVYDGYKSLINKKGE